jgi:hypothetical protein
LDARIQPQELKDKNFGKKVMENTLLHLYNTLLTYQINAKKQLISSTFKDLTKKAPFYSQKLFVYLNKL